MKKKTIRVLIIEHNVLDARRIADLLTEGQNNLFIVETADRLSLAKDKLAKVRFDTILLDVNLPDSKGIDTLRKLIPLATDVPIVVYSTTDKESIAQTALQAGAQDFLIKGEITAVALSRSLLYGIERNRIHVSLGKEQQKINQERSDGQEKGRDITERKRAEEALLERERRLSAVTDNLPGTVSHVDHKLRYLFANAMYERWHGKKPESILGRTIPEVIGDEAFRRIKPYIKQALAGQRVTFEGKIEVSSGETIYGLVTYIPDVDSDGKVKGFFVVVNDITDRKRTEDHIAHLNRVLRSIRTINQVMVKEKDKEKLLEDACHILSELSGYYFVWIGMIEEGHKRVVPAAHYGYEDGYLTKVKMTWDGEATGMGPTGTAIKTGKTSVLKDLTEPRYAPWRKEAEKRGYKSSIATPIFHGENIYGALNVYADQTDLFDAEEIKLLEEVAGDIGYALWAIESKQRQEQAQQDIGYLKEFNENIINAMPDPIDIIDKDMVLVFQNRASREKYGDGLGKKCHKHYRKNIFPCEYCTAVLSLTDKTIHVRETRMEDGSWLEIHSLPISLPDGQQCALEIMKEITDRKLAEEALKENEEKYRSLVENINDVVFNIDLNGTVMYISPVAEQISGFSVDEYIKKNFAEFIHPEDLPKLISVFRQSLKGVKKEAEFRTITKTGSYRYVRSSSNPIVEAGSIIGFTGLITDITERKRAEEELGQLTASLIESERRLKALINNIPDIAWLKDAECRFLAVNDPFGRSCGFSPEDLVGKSDFDIWPEDLARRYQEDDREVMRSRTVKIIEEPLVDKQGKINWIETIKTPIYDERGKVVGTVGIARDLTERRKAEEELRQSEALFRNLFERHAAVKLILDLDTGRIVDANEAAVKFYGWPSERLKEMRIQDINTLPPDEVKKEIEKVRSLERVHFEFRHRRADGSVRDVEVFSSKIEAKGKELLHSIIHDVTDRRRAEEALRESEEKFRNLFETSPDFIYIAALDGRIIDVNQAVRRLSGYSPEEFKNLNIVDFYADPEDREKLVKEVLREGFIDACELKLKKKDGTLINALVTVISTKDKDGNAVGFQGVVRDITEKRNMELQLLQTEKLSAVGTMISGVAHELNNPLTSIIGNAQLLAKRDVPEDIKNKLSVILKESIRSSKIVGGLLAFAREHKPERKMININDILMESVKLREYDLKVSNIDMRVSLFEELPETSADPYQLQQVFINLINNARDAIADREKGALAIRTYRKDDAVLIEFEDNGPGIPDKFIKKIFDPFFTTKETGKGTGLGLSMVYGIIKEHGGTISVESRPGKGVKFIVTLPILEHSEVILEDLKTPIKVPHGVKTVLVVEDEASLRDFLAEVLIEGGFFVEAASTGEQAIDLVGKRKFDAVISDIKMPGIGGKDLYLYIHRHHPEMVEKIVFITGDVLSKDTLLFLQTINGRFIEKPFNVDALIAILNDVLSK
jgi:PAS domain S-box-containing protein